MTEPKRTYFGLGVLELRGFCVVRKADIRQLPVYEFWEDSAIGSTYLAGRDGGPGFVCVLPAN